MLPGSEDATPRARIEVFDVGFAIVMTARAPRPIVLVVATVLDAFPQIQLCFGSSLRCRLEMSSGHLPRAIGASGELSDRTRARTHAACVPSSGRTSRAATVALGEASPDDYVTCENSTLLSDPLMVSMCYVRAHHVPA